MFTSDLDAHGQVILSAEQKRRQVASALRGQGFAVELAIELAILAGLNGINGDALHALLMSATIVTEALVRQTVLQGATGLLYVLGTNLTAQEAFAHIAAKGIAGTTGVFLGPGITPPITHHFTSTGCEARCELAIVTMIRNLLIPLALIRKAWAFAEACWSGNQADQLRPRVANGGPLLSEQNTPNEWWQHVATALLTDGGLVILDPSVHPAGPLLLRDWHHLLGVANNHPGQTQETVYGQPPVLGGQPCGVLGYATLSEPPTQRDCLIDASQQMRKAYTTIPLPNL